MLIQNIDPARAAALELRRTMGGPFQQDVDQSQRAYEQFKDAWRSINAGEEIRSLCAAICYSANVVLAIKNERRHHGHHEADYPTLTEYADSLRAAIDAFLIATNGPHIRR